MGLSFSDLVQKAKRAKKKLLKREDDRTDSGSQERYESFSYGGVDPYMWEPQEVGRRARKQYAVGITFNLNWESATVLLKLHGIVSVLRLIHCSMGLWFAY